MCTSALKTVDTCHTAANLEEDVSSSENNSTKKHKLRHNASSKDDKIHFLTRTSNEHPLCTHKIWKTTCDGLNHPGLHSYAFLTTVPSESTKKSHLSCIRYSVSMFENTV